MSKGIFGNMFDFNGDGDLNFAEQAMEYAFLDDLMKEDKKEESTGFFGDPLSDDDEDEDWRDKYILGELGIDPVFYDTEEEYREAVEEKQAWIDGISDNISALADEYCINPEDYDSYEDFVDAVKDMM